MTKISNAVRKAVELGGAATLIVFERVERDCPFNKNLIKAGERGAIYDYKVLIDGEHRALIVDGGTYSGRARYYIVDVDHRDILEKRLADDRYPDGRCRWRSASWRFKKDEFRAIVINRLAEGMIPTSDDLRRLRANDHTAKLKEQQEQRDKDLLRRKEIAAEKMFDLLKGYANVSENTPPKGYNSTDWKKRQRAACSLILKIEDAP